MAKPLFYPLPSCLATLTFQVVFSCNMRGDGCWGEDFAEQAGQLAPLAIFSGAAHGTCQRFESSQGGNLRLQFVDGARRGGLVQDLFLSRLHLIVWCIF